MRKAVVLTSGGLDSATTLAMARRDGFSCYCLSIDYGQRHKIELEMAAWQARYQRAIEHRTVAVDLRAIGGSALTDDIAVPAASTGAMGIPITYVPARNTVLLAVCLGYAEVVGAYELFIGANAVDYSGYPDCRPAFLNAFEALANVATKAAVEDREHFRVHAPLLNLAKADIVRQGTALGVDYAHTLSCYDPDAEGRACGRCDSCALRRQGFVQAGLPDPTNYQTK